MQLNPSLHARLRLTYKKSTVPNVHTSQTTREICAKYYYMRQPKLFFVYIMANRSGSASLYIGITGDLVHRAWQHKQKTEGFSARYNLTRLVYFEQFHLPDVAIAREKEIKGWRREKKIKLIESMNPRWNDLAKDWQNLYKPGSSCNEIPRPASENAGLRDDAIHRDSALFTTDKAPGSR